MLPGVLKTEAKQPVDAVPGLQSDGGAGVFGPGRLRVGVVLDHRPQVLVHPVKVQTGVEPFGVLSYDHEVEAVRGEVHHRAHVGEQLESLTQLHYRRYELHAGATQRLNQFRLSLTDRFAGDRTQQAGVRLL